MALFLSAWLVCSENFIVVKSQGDLFCSRVHREHCFPIFGVFVGGDGHVCFLEIETKSFQCLVIPVISILLDVRIPLPCLCQNYFCFPFIPERHSHLVNKHTDSKPHLLALPRTSCVTWGTLLSFPAPRFHQSQNKNNDCPWVRSLL